VSSPALDESESLARPRSSTRFWAKVAVKLVLSTLVLVAVGRHALKTWHDLEAKGASVHVAAVPFVTSIVIYVAGLVPLGIYYGRIVNTTTTPMSMFAALRAYLISHLGKYVPGKALVVVMRVGLSTPYGCRAATSAFAALYETLTMMAAGGLLAGLAFGWGATVAVPGIYLSGQPISVPLPLIGLTLGFMFFVIIDPHIFPKLAGLARMPFPGVGPDALPKFSYRLLFEGLLLATLGWILLGLSQVAVLSSLMPTGLPISIWPTAIASVALATVAGFVIPISPGGLGVREWVLWTALGSVMDQDLAVVAALVLRLAWVIGEVLTAAIVVLIRPASRLAAS
jgi:hypothetical protein